MLKMCYTFKKKLQNCWALRALPPDSRIDNPTYSYNSLKCTFLALCFNSVPMKVMQCNFRVFAKTVLNLVRKILCIMSHSIDQCLTTEFFSFSHKISEQSNFTLCIFSHSAVCCGIGIVFLRNKSCPLPHSSTTLAGKHVWPKTYFC